MGDSVRCIGSDQLLNTESRVKRYKQHHQLDQTDFSIFTWYGLQGAGQPDGERVTRTQVAGAGGTVLQIVRPDDRGAVEVGLEAQGNGQFSKLS